ncbi:hypothetical protein NE237_032230 [Protea cynaroides]|uniref:CID domain-containing protein n=1 Tax=Protea cynaroides TaxID=273540 RepID=A0A9Q0L2Q2_9MAGN|nr:hypothetical protein NE237_032230 [Protea cynaroides]
MDQQAHDYAAAAAMAFAQQQQQQAANIQQQQLFGFHPQHQQYLQQMHGPSLLVMITTITNFGSRPSGAPFNLPFHPSSIPLMPPNPMMNPTPLNPPSLNAPAAAAVASASMSGAPQLHQHSFPPFYDQQQQQHPQHLMGPHSLMGLSRPLPSDVGAELNNVLNNLSGTKESIKGAKMWFMQRSPFAPALAEVLKDRVPALDDSERQLHIIYLANDILFDSGGLILVILITRPLPSKPIGTMLARVYHNPHNKEANQSRLQKILQFWASKEVYDPETLYGLESEMLNGPPSSLFFGLPNESAISADPSSSIGS